MHVVFGYPIFRFIPRFGKPKSGNQTSCPLVDPAMFILVPYPAFQKMLQAHVLSHLPWEEGTSCANDNKNNHNNNNNNNNNIHRNVTQLSRTPHCLPTSHLATAFSMKSMTHQMSTKELEQVSFSLIKAAIGSRPQVQRKRCIDDGLYAAGGLMLVLVKYTYIYMCVCVCI